MREGIERFDTLYFEPSYARRTALLEQFTAGQVDEASLPRDVLMMLIRNEDGIDLTRAVLLREMAFFALAGAHTSIHTLSHAMHETLNWCETHPADRRRLDEEPFFLQRCVHESMRMHPSSPIALRRSMCPLHLPAVGEVGGGDLVTIDLFTANRDPMVFGDDAGVFNPHRAIAKGEPHGLSFGLGMHACLGRNLAAGVIPKHDADAATHHYGTVTKIARTLFDHGVRPDPDQPPRRDATTNRILWAYYPVLLDQQS
ncbi:MAG: cytochrome P450 [Gammaproteobacteria bacterium]|nr:cytochrome P450 [Gammaproteobacteria bacterium]